MYTYPTVRITYKGNPLTRRQYDENPEIHHLYPSRETFMQILYLPLLQKARDTNTEQLLEVSENSIKINGVPFELH